MLFCLDHPVFTGCLLIPSVTVTFPKGNPSRFSNRKQEANNSICYFAYILKNFLFIYYKTGKNKPAFSKSDPAESYIDPSLSPVVETIFTDLVLLSNPHGTNTRLSSGVDT
jgi:hypothetical protein